MSHSFMFSDKTPFGLHHNSCVILNLKAAEGSSRELTRQSLVDIEEVGTNVWGQYVRATRSSMLWLRILQNYKQETLLRMLPSTEIKKCSGLTTQMRMNITSVRSLETNSHPLRARYMKKGVVCNP